MERILPKAGYKAPRWCFEPQVLMYRKDDMHVTLKVRPSWFGWGMAKAAWKFEPGYRQASGGAPVGQYNMTEDKECLATLAFTLSNDTSREWDQQPELAALHKAFMGKMFEEYLLYEIVLPKFPVVVYQLSRSQLDEIKNYLLDVRCSG